MSKCLRCGGEWRGKVARPKVCRFCGSRKWDEPFDETKRKIDQRHGQTNHRLYHTWCSMLKRCDNPSHPHYKDYGGRGIGVCSRWYNLGNFICDMDGAYKQGLSLDRADNDKEYSPTNCGWATRKEQGRNKRSNRTITIGGETMPFVEWRERFDISKSTIQGRVRRGMSIVEALTTPINMRYSHRKEGQTRGGTK